MSTEPAAHERHDRPDRRPIIPPGSEAVYERFHFAPAFQVGDTIHVSGVIGRGPDGTVPDDPAEEYAAVFEQLGTVLAAGGATLADVVDLTSFHVDLPRTLGLFMAARDAVLTAPYPAWTAIGCSALASPGARVEVKATAVIDRAGRRQ